MGKFSGTTTSGREKAYAHLRESVLTDPQMQGQFIKETDLAADLGISRTPVREALMLLVSEGLVEPDPAARRIRSSHLWQGDLGTHGTPQRS